MADAFRLSRFNRFYGGIVVDDRSRAEGVCLNMEELDPFESRSYILPQIIFELEGATSFKILGFTFDDGDNAYAIGNNGGGVVRIWKRTSASQSTPSAWSSFFSSGSTVNAFSPVIWHKLTSGADYLYYVTGTSTLKRLGDLPTTTETTVGTMTGLTGTFDRIPMIRTNDELYIGNGQHISNVDDTGTFVDQFASIYPGWKIVDFARISNNLAILARSEVAGENRSKVFFWDFSQNPDSMIDEIDIPMGGPQIIMNHNEVLRVLCAKNGILRAYAINGRRPTLTHTLYNIATETSTQPIIPAQSKFLYNNIMYFGLWKTDKTGLYAIGQVDEQAPVALILAKRFNTSDYSLHKPYAAASAGPNMMAAYLDNVTDEAVDMIPSDPTYSSLAVYESVWYDASNPEVSKQWEGFILNTTPITSVATIAISGRVDNASSYDSASLKTLGNGNDQLDSGGTADTNWIRTWQSLVGRTLQTKLAWTSSGSDYAKLYQFSLLHRDGVIENL